MKLIEVLKHKDGAIEYIQDKRECIRNGVCKRDAYIVNDTEYIVRQMYPLARVKVRLSDVDKKLAELKEAQGRVWRDEDLSHVYDSIKEYTELRNDIVRLLS